MVGVSIFGNSVCARWCRLISLVAGGAGRSG